MRRPGSLRDRDRRRGARVQEAPHEELRPRPRLEEPHRERESQGNDHPLLKSAVNDRGQLRIPACRPFNRIKNGDGPNAPEIVEIEPATPDEPLPGKSSVLYDPKDRKEIDKLLAEVERRGKQDRD